MVTRREDWNELLGEKSTKGNLGQKTGPQEKTAGLLVKGGALGFWEESFCDKEISKECENHHSVMSHVDREVPLRLEEN